LRLLCLPSPHYHLASGMSEGSGGAEVEARERRMLHLVMGHQLCTLSTSLLTMQPRAQLLLKALGGDSAAVAVQISRGAFLLALSDLLLSPSVGALSDRVGRKPLMLLAPAVALPLKLLAAARPSVAVLLVERVLGDAFRTLGGTTMAYACLCDLCKGEAYTVALGRVNAATGLGIVVAPLAAAAVMGRSGHPRRAYLASALVAFAHLVLGALLLRETRPCKPEAGRASEAEKPTVLQPAWQFLKFFTAGPRLRWRAWLFALHCMMEGKVLQDQVSVLQIGEGWTTVRRSRWTSGLGVAMLVGGQATGALVRHMGEHRFAALCHVASLGAFGLLRTGAFWTSLLLLCLGQQRRSASTAWLLGEAARAGVGRGEAVGRLASLRAAVDGAAALLYGAAYRAGAARGKPQEVLLVPAAAAVASEALRMLLAAGAGG